VQEAIRVGLDLKARPNAKQMAPLAEPWRPLRGAAAHLWWSFYRAIRKREGVIAPAQAVEDQVDAFSPAGARIRRGLGSNHPARRFHRRPK
jgi:DNA-3-methyladenine glycosylase II